MPRRAATVDPQTDPTSPTAGIQEAVDALPESGGAVYLRPGVYTLRCSIKLRPNVTLRGAGPSTILTRPSPRRIPLAKRTVKGLRHIALRHVRGLRVGDQLVIEDDKCGGWNACHAIVRDIEGSVAKMTLVVGTPETGFSPKRNAAAASLFPAIWLPWAHGAVIENLAIDGRRRRHAVAGGFTVAAIHTRRADDIRIRDVVVRRWPGDGISVQKGEGAVVSGCLVEDCAGIGLHPGSGLERSVWANNISRRNRHGFLFCQGVVHAIVQGNLIHHNRENGIFGLGFPDAHNVIMGNVVSENGQFGIEAYRSVGNVIQGNIVRSNSRSKRGTYAGIHLEEHRDTIVTGNRSFDDREKPTQITGILSIDPSGDNVIRDNLEGAG